MATFFTSDTHFNQERTFKFSMRNMYFKDLQAMNEEMVRRWNEIVGPGDTVYHLGDFGDFSFLEKLNGKIILLEGNYEREGRDVPTKEQLNMLKEYVKDLSIYGFDKKMLMVHEPSNTGNYTGFYLFGHIHEKQKVKNGKDNYPSESERYGLNVGVDCHNFTPVSMKTVDFYRKAIKDIYDEECFTQF